MTRFRDPSLTTWTAIVAVLAALLVSAWVLGSPGHGSAKPTTTVSSTVGATRSATGDTVTQMRSLSQAAIAAGANPAAIRAWAQQVAALAQQAATVRAAEGASQDDPLYGTFADLYTTAAGIRPGTGGDAAVAADSARTRILMLLDRAYEIGHGMPVGDTLPGTPTAPLPGGEVTAPTIPTDPATPKPAPGNHAGPVTPPATTPLPAPAPPSIDPSLLKESK